MPILGVSYPTSNRRVNPNRSDAQRKRIDREFWEGYAAYTGGQIERLREVSGGAPLDTGQYITVGDAAKHLGLTRQRIYQLIRSGKIQAVRVGDFHKVWLINRDTMPPARLSDDKK